ncbi:hypothetical protein QWY14_02535 [Planococcus sp. N028]|uniref:DUF1616 domain-containing protein n=1 Tax=Planococcus shixiaomingii TaxID=3058393 RepID=A0ABT8MYC3_9BACL|nr:hypothetical protein [Planococcus sp. N028]MDN7240645.1 hypothetical protein [Planococcus sp. N028]
MILRKFVSTLVTSMLVFLIYLLLTKSGVGLLIVVYLIPFLLFYGIPVSIFSDFVTRKLKGVTRGGVALAIHLSLATLLNLILYLFSYEGWEPVGFILVNSLLSAFLLWSIDEILKSAKVKRICQKIDDLKIY